MKKIDINAALEATRQIKTTTDALRSRKAELINQKYELEGRNQVLYRQPLLPDEIKQLILSRIDSLAAGFPQVAKWDNMFSSFATPKGLRPKMEGVMDTNPAGFAQSSRAISLQDFDAMQSDDGRRRVLGPGVDASFFGGAGGLDALDERRACFFFGDIIKPKVEQYFNRFSRAMEANWFNTSDENTIEEKRIEIGRNDAQIVQLDEELSGIEAQLQALTDAGVPAEKAGGVR